MRADRSGGLVESAQILILLLLRLWGAGDVPRWLWLERSRIDAADTRLLESPLGLGGHKCMGTLWLASGTPLTRERREQLLEAVRAVSGGEHGVQVGATCPNPQMVVVRALAPLVEPLMAQLQHVWATLRTEAWGLPNEAPRIWRV